eukprot:CAMPEP_0194205190 /NCGR_PEP_ID=MMETSP0156-20130528/4509_1 /TAXON_ID=33649 /ORGANISM="Thalassionema nitzschioides, Strain L26-B" /LENGTH=671 /DNA_ID=CAMNT_0038931393 /DNA_START=28 /DNA_END=2043 /DNA_ORIENTATION=-
MRRFFISSRCALLFIAVVTGFLRSAKAFSTGSGRQSTRQSTSSLPANLFNSEDDSDNELYQPKQKNVVEEKDEVDIAIIGAGIGGLCAGAILNTLHGKKVGIYESHYLPGGCAHAFQRVAKVKKGEKVVFTYDSGPTIVLGCSAPPYNPLRQILNAVGTDHLVDWIRYDGWGMIENPGKNGGIDDEKTKRWRLELGPDVFEAGPLSTFSSTPQEAIDEFHELQKATQPLVSGAVEIPALAMRSGNLALIPLLRYLPALWGLIQQGDVTTGTFAPFMDGPLFTVKNPWLRSWLDALAFSLSGLPAKRTAAAAMAYVLYDMHRPGAALDYPQGGLGSVIEALVKGVEQGSSNNSKVHLRQHVEEILTNEDGTKAVGLKLRGGKKVVAKDGVICNAPVWLLNGLVKNEKARSILKNDLLPNQKRNARQTWETTSSTYNSIRYDRPNFEFEDDDDSLLAKCDTSEQTGSFLHLHMALDATGLDLDSLETHYTVMDRGLSGDSSSQQEDNDDGPCGELNMIAVSNPCVLDRSLAPEGYIVVHAYGAGNEPYHVWEGMDRNSKEYKTLKEERSQVLWRAVEAVIPDARSRVVHDMVGSPLTHARFLRRPRGTYGSATEDYLKDGSTPIQNLVLCGDGVFPGIGVPSVALSGASAANALVGVLEQWKTLDDLKAKELI